MRFIAGEGAGLTSSLLPAQEADAAMADHQA